MIDATNWIRTPKGFIRVPPRYCPACGWGWPSSGPYRPRQLTMFCSCRSSHSHPAWTCTCGAIVAEGCLDVSGWGRASTPAGLADELRWVC